MIRALFWAVLLPATALILAIVSVAGAHSQAPCSLARPGGAPGSGCQHLQGSAPPPEGTVPEMRPVLQARPGTPPPGKGCPSWEGAVPRASRARGSRARDFTPSRKRGLPWRAAPAPLPDACRQHVDRINQALAAKRRRPGAVPRLPVPPCPDPQCHRRRPQDADGFRRYAAHQLADLAARIHWGHLSGAFRSGVLLIPGGDWRPDAEGGEA